MSSSTNSKPKIKPTQSTKAAIIRPVNRRSGKQTFVRIDDAQSAVRPNVRALQLEDYVAQIRGVAAVEEAPVAETEVAPAPSVPAEPATKQQAVPPKPKLTKKITLSRPTKTKTPRAPRTVAVKTQRKPSIATDVARQQQSASAELTHAEHVDVLNAVAKLDAGYQWIADSNRSAAEESAEIARSLKAATAAGVVAAAVAAPQTTTQPVSQELVNSIATAIASVLTDMPENKLSEKIESGVVTIATQTAAPAPAPANVPTPTPVVAEEETLKLSPEVPRPEYTLPVTAAHSIKPAVAATPAAPTTQPVAPQTQSKLATSGTVSLFAAAWDVPAFRWPTVTDQILSIDHMMSALANNCETILSPFGKTIVVTAPTRGQGTTTMSLTLARAFASRNKRVLMVDGDIMQPTLSSTVGVGGVNWYGNHVEQQSIGECIVQGKSSGVCLMPLDAPIANVEPYSAPIFDLLERQIDKVRGEFDLVVIDAGPVWQIVDEISSNSHLVDAAMLVNQDMHSNGFAEARERLMDRGIFKFIAAQNSFARKAG